MYKKVASLLAVRIGDCLGAITAGLFFVTVSLRSEADAAFLYMGLPMLALGFLATAIAFTSRG